MKKKLSLFLGILLLINSSCQNESAKVLKKTKKNHPKSLQIVKRNIDLVDPASIKDAVKKNENFLKVVESFKPETYTKDELIDITDKNLKLFKIIQTRHFKSKVDTAAVKSRLILTEINLKRLNFLLHKKHIKTDTIQKTLDEIIRNLNSVIKKIKLYSKASDEFENILVHDSIMKIKRDSLIKMKNTLKSLNNKAKK